MASLQRMEKHAFLSPGWVAESRRIRGDYRSKQGESHTLVSNYTITGVPFLDGETAEFHLDLQSPLFYENGHAESADFHVTTDYQTAREVAQDSSWGLTRLVDGYADGSIHIEGEVDELREFWADVIRKPGHAEMYDQIMEITA